MDSISLKSSTKKAMLTKRSINYYRISGNIRESLRLEEQSCSLHKPQQQCLTLTMKPGCSTLLKEYMKVKVEMLVTQSCLILCDPTDCSPLGSFVHGVLYERILEWVAIPFSRESSWPRQFIRQLHIPSKWYYDPAW